MSDQARVTQASGVTPGACRLADKVDWFRSRQVAGDEAIETHFAWVFLTGDRAWKLRKPVRRDSMDYGTLEARRRDSEAEVRLNRRLAPHVYLGTQPLTLRADGRLAIGGAGEIVDWLVEMRRLDRRRMLDVRLARRDVPADDLARVAARIDERELCLAERPGGVGIERREHGLVRHDLGAQPRGKPRTHQNPGTCQHQPA